MIAFLPNTVSSTTVQIDVYKRQGVDQEEGEKSPQFHEKVMERQEHQQEREQAFLSQNRDCFAIYQVKHTDELRDIRYEGLDWLRSIGQAVKRENYDLCLLYTSRCV